MRFTLTALGRTLLDVRLLEDDDPTDETREPWPVDSTAERFTGDPPFGFRPTPDPWPPSWE